MKSVTLAARALAKESNSGRHGDRMQNTSIGSVEPPGPLVAGSSSMILPFYDIQGRRDPEDDRFGKNATATPIAGQAIELRRRITPVWTKPRELDALRSWSKVQVTFTLLQIALQRFLCSTWQTSSDEKRADIALSTSLMLVAAS